MVEFIGFFISLMALAFLFFNKRTEGQRRKEHPEAFQENEANDNDPLRELLKALDQEASSASVVKRPASPPPRTEQVKAKSRPMTVANKPKKPSVSSLENYQFQTEIEKRRLQSSIESRHIVSDIEKRQPLGKSEGPLLPKHTRLPNLKQMVIYYEIFNRPKGL